MCQEIKARRTHTPTQVPASPSWKGVNRQMDWRILKIFNIFNTVNNKEHGRGQRSVVWLKRSPPCSHHIHVLSTVFSWQPFSSFSLWIILLPPSLPPPPPRFILPLLNQCDGCLVPLVWGLTAGGCGFAGYGGVTLSRGWLCQRWKPLDIPGTHLH